MRGGGWLKKILLCYIMGKVVSNFWAKARINSWNVFLYGLIVSAVFLVIALILMFVGVGSFDPGMAAGGLAMWILFGIAGTASSIGLVIWLIAVIFNA